MGGQYNNDISFFCRQDVSSNLSMLPSLACIYTPTGMLKQGRFTQDHQRPTKIANLLPSWPLDHVQERHCPLKSFKPTSKSSEYQPGNYQALGRPVATFLLEQSPAKKMTHATKTRNRRRPPH